MSQSLECGDQAMALGSTESAWWGHLTCQLEWDAVECQGNPREGGLLRGGGRGCRQAPNSSDSKTKQAFKMPSLMKSECWKRWEFSLGKTAESQTESCEGRWALRPLRPPLLPGSLGVGCWLGTERENLQVWEGSV